MSEHQAEWHEEMLLRGYQPPVKRSASFAVTQTVRECVSAAEGWISRQDVMAKTGLSERTVELVAGCNPGMFLSGNNGYRILEYSDDMDAAVGESVARKRAQAYSMLHNAREQDAAWAGIKASRAIRQRRTVETNRADGSLFDENFGKVLSHNNT